MQTKTLKSDSLLLLAAFFWGTTFVAQRRGMEYIGPMTYNTVRFAVGALTVLPIALTARRSERTKHVENHRRFLLWGSALAGLALFGGAAMQQMGLVYTPAGKAGFITSLYVVLVPIAGLFLGHRCGLSAWVAAALAVIGLYLLSAAESLALGRGDLLVLIGAFFWTLHVLTIDYLAKRANPLHIACLQFAICSLLSLPAALVFERVALSSILQATGPILYAGIFSAGVAFTLQVVCQRTSPPSHAAILMSLETVFAALSGYLVLHERFTPRDLVGCALMFAALMVVQLPLLRGSPSLPKPEIDTGLETTDGL
ncbi:MAG: DMT family transporter [Phycisphaerae bacterium]|nr:DMT family transporter [Phycisphaerae bacterium]